MTNAVEPRSKILPVILAGGSGTRLWPMSRKYYAKQYLSFDQGNTLLQNTILRCEAITDLPFLVVCNEETRFLAAEQLRQIEKTGAPILLEPVGRNTAPAIALAALEAQANGDDPLLLVMPADHKIDDLPKFHNKVSQARALAAAGSLVTFGIEPDRSETGYGYIRYGAAINDDAYKVDKFVEKPAAMAAQAYVDSGQYCWNSGMFLFRASRYLEELSKFRPDILTACQDAFEGRKRDVDFIRFDKKKLENCAAESIDYAVMEHTKDAVVMPMAVGWSDIGSWASLWEALPKSNAGNCEIGDVISHGGSGNYISANHRLVATIGLKDIVVVETKDAVLVAPKNQVQNVGKIVDILKSKNREEVNYHREVFRPWGKYDSVDAGQRYQVKRITVKPGAKLSVQKHHHRAEHWVVVTGTAKVTRGEETILLTENQSTYIPLGEVHALENPGLVPLELIEVQSGSYLGEDDIIRFEDRYGRD